MTYPLRWNPEVFSLKNDREAKRRNAREPLGTHVRSFWTRRSNQKLLTLKPHKRLLIGSVPSKGLTCAPRDSLAFGFASRSFCELQNLWIPGLVPPHFWISSDCTPTVSFRLVSNNCWHRVFFSPFTAKHVIDKKSTSSQALCRGMKSLHSREKVRRHGVPQPMLSCAGRVVRNLKHGNYCAATVYDACSLAKLSSTDAFFVTSLQNLLNFHPNPQDFISTKIQSPGWWTQSNVSWLSIRKKPIKNILQNFDHHCLN